MKMRAVWREKAYSARRQIVTTDRREQQRLTDERIDLKHMDWDFVGRYSMPFSRVSESALLAPRLLPEKRAKLGYQAARFRA